MRYLNAFIFSLCLNFALGCTNPEPTKVSVATPGGGTAECETGAAANGATLIYCDEFNQTAGKLSTTTPEKWIDQN